MFQVNLPQFFRRNRITWLLPAAAACVLTGCSTFPGWLSSAGPSREQVAEIRPEARPEIQLVSVDDAVARRVLAVEKHGRFADAFGDKGSQGLVVGAGDILQVSIWEAPPAILFAGPAGDARSIAASGVTTLPEQMVSTEGTINIPFAGNVAVAGKSPQKIEAEIVKRLVGKANQPQAMVRVTRNATANVTVVGDVAQSQRMPLTAKGERLLDALAAAGGVRQPVGKMSLQLTRGDVVQSMALDNIIQDPKQNIVLQPGDVVTALFQPLSFTALGATGKNEEVAFEARGITLAQALARVGGLQDARADARGVFIFRLEEPRALAAETRSAALTPEGKVPVVYVVDLKDPRSFFSVQGFPMRDKDVMYVANAPAAELQKFLNILTSSIYSVAAIGNVTK